MTEEEKKEKKTYFKNRLPKFHYLSKDKVERLNELHDLMKEKIIIEISVLRFNYIEYLQAWCALIDQFILIAIEEAKAGKANPEEVQYSCLQLKRDQKILEKDLYEFGAIRNDSKINLIPKLERLLSKEKYNKEKYIENALNIEQSILDYIRKNEINDKKISNKIHINPYPYIFSSDKAYYIFSKMHESFKNKKSVFVANYSFLYYAMLEDKYLSCNQTTYIDFLNDTFKILIDRVDSRQNKNEKKHLLYTSYKNNA